MKLLVAFLSMCALALGAVLPKFDDKIIGGEETTIENHPYQISLHYNGSHVCGGSIINENTILTACHCVYGRKSKGITIRVGSTDNTDGEEYEVARVIEHPDFMEILKFDNDVAILKLAKPLTFSDKVQPIELQAANTTVPEGTKALVSGWGNTEYPDTLYPTKLHVVDVDVISNDRCVELYRFMGEVSESMLCTLNTNNYNFCLRDDGGPLVAGGKLIGVVSWGFGCTFFKYPGVYAKVSVLRDFIDQNL